MHVLNQRTWQVEAQQRRAVAWWGCGALRWLPGYQLCFWRLVMNVNTRVWIRLVRVAADQGGERRDERSIDDQLERVEEAHGNDDVGSGDAL